MLGSISGRLRVARALALAALVSSPHHIELNPSDAGIRDREVVQEVIKEIAQSAPVIRASPVGQPPILRHSSSRSGPAARWMAPSTPPPPSSDSLAAFTIASTVSAVRSPLRTCTR